MNSNNVVTIISNNAKAIDEVSSKLVLLRDLDKIEHTNTIEALEFVKNKLPDVIILHAIFDDPKRLELLRDIKREKLLKNSSVILLAEDCGEDFLIEAFDLGVTDIISYPFKKAELLLRVMWAIRKNEVLENTDLRNTFLTNLGIIDLSSGFYSKKYCEEYFNNEVEYAVKHNTTACVMLVSAEKIVQERVSPFYEVIKKAIRLNDSAGTVSKNKFYIFLPKTKLNGAYTVFDRLKLKAQNNYKVSAAVVETTNKPFAKIQKTLDDALVEANSEDNSLVVASTNTIKVDVKEKTAVFTHKDTVPKKTTVIDNATLSAELNKQLEKLKKTKKNVPVKNINIDAFADLKNEIELENLKSGMKKSEKNDIEIRNSIVYKQAFERKCSLVIEPVFEKYKNMLQGANKYVFAQYNIGFEKSYFKVVKGANELTVEIIYEGYSSLKIDAIHIFNGRLKNAKTTEVELVKFDKKAFSELFDKLIKTIG